ncbi:MAG: WbqC family protein [Sulfuriferula sp.]
MRIAGMQPYFLPYLGYWQLIHSVDLFILGDDFQYMNDGWINRNRFLKQDGGWFYLTLPVQKHSMREQIRNIQLPPQVSLYKLLNNALIQYRCRGRAPYFDEIYALLLDTVKQIETKQISRINEVLIRAICTYLEINTEIKVMSESGLKFREEQSPDDRTRELCSFFHGTEYTNPIAGVHLYDPATFRSSGLKLKALQSHEIIYAQRDGFEPSLSIVDVLMYNGRSGTQALLEACTVTEII